LTIPRNRITHDGQVHSVSWSPDGKTLAFAGGDGTVRLWEAATGKEQATLKGHTAGVSSVSWSPDGKTLASRLRSHSG
jgi:WD40 repeat protein